VIDDSGIDSDIESGPDADVDGVDSLVFRQRCQRWKDSLVGARMSCEGQSRSIARRYSAGSKS
jgi:hypothetical protein